MHSSALITNAYNKQESVLMAHWLRKQIQLTMDRNQTDDKAHVRVLLICVYLPIEGAYANTNTVNGVDWKKRENNVDEIKVISHQTF